MIAFLRELMQPEWMFLRYALLVGALASLSLGVIGEYVGKIYLESKHRPRYVISERTWERDEEE